MKIVIDTNVFVSSVFGGLPRRVVNLWFAGRVALCLSEFIVREYRRVLCEIDAVSNEDERVLLRAFATGANVAYTDHPPPIQSACSDPDDEKFLACALELEAEAVVSGDSNLLDLRSYMGIPILGPRAFLEQIGEISDGPNP